MSKKTDKQRIVALQKMLAVARCALEKIEHGHTSQPWSIAESALEEISRLDLMSKPTPLAGVCGHERARP